MASVRADVRGPGDHRTRAQHRGLSVGAQCKGAQRKGGSAQREG